jgi:hypothetical protein
MACFSLSALFFSEPPDCACLVRSFDIESNQRLVVGESPDHFGRLPPSEKRLASNFRRLQNAVPALTPKARRPIDPAMDSEDRLREKLRKIEALFAGAGTEGERAAAGAAAERIRAQLRQAEKAGRIEEMRFSLPDPWARRMFLALCRRYGLKPFRFRGQRHTTVMVRAPESFVTETLWPEFQEINRELARYLDEVTERIIREEVHGETADAEERDEPRRLA